MVNHRLLVRLVFITFLFSGNPSIELVVTQPPDFTQPPDLTPSVSKWPVIRPCVLCNVVDRSALSSDSNDVPVFFVPDRLMRAIWSGQDVSTPKCIWLLGLTNGWLYVLGRPTVVGPRSCAVHCVPLCSLPVAGSITHWCLLEDPILNATNIVPSGPRPVSTVLLAFHASGSGLALWVLNSVDEGSESE